MAKIPAPSDRPVYRPSGRVRGLALAWGGLMATLAGLLVSGLMTLCSLAGIYLLIMVPMAAGLISGYLAMLVVRQSHCRNSWLAGLLGLMIGIVAYLGHYHLDMLRAAGFDHWQRVDVLPSYIWARWEMDTVGRVGRGNNAPPLFIMNLAISVVELSLMAGISASLAAAAASKPYAEAANCWMTSSVAHSQAGTGALIADALKQRSAEALSSAVQAPVSVDEGYCQLDFWMCSTEQDPEREEPLLLSISEYGPANKEGKRNFQPLIQLWEIDPAEMVVFAQRLPSLVTWLQSNAQQPSSAEE